MAFTFVNGNAVVSEIEVFDTKACGFQQTKPAPVKEMGHKAVITFKMSQDGSRFGFAKDDGQSSRAADALDAVDELQFPIEDVLVEKEQSREGLVLGRSGDITIDRKMAQKCRDVFFVELTRVTFAVKKNETADPIDVGLLGANAVTLDAQMPADAVKQFPGGR